MRPELIELIKKHEKDSIPGTEHIKALKDFAVHCCDYMSYDPDSNYILDYFEEVYQVGFDRGFKAGKG